MKETESKMQYEAPELEVLEVVVEKGFAHTESGAFEDEWGDVITPGMG